MRRRSRRRPWRHRRAAPPEESIAELVSALTTSPAGAPDTFTAEAPDWSGERVFGGLVVGIGLAAALAHLLVGAFLSDLTGTSIRPHDLGEWGTHTDASIDHAAWFHRPPRFDDWTSMDFHAVVNQGGRSTVHGATYDRDGTLLITMAQELLIRPIDAA